MTSKKGTEFSESGIFYPFTRARLRPWFDNTENLYDRYIAKKIMEKYDAEKTKEDPAGAGSKRTE
jgi:hypothetical protein